LRIIELCKLRWGGGGATLSQPEWWRVLEYYWPIVDGLIRSGQLCLLYFDLSANRVRVVVIFLECYCLNEPQGRAQLFEDLEWGWQNPVWPPLVIRVAVL